MIGPVPLLLAVQGAIFLVWATLAFRILFHLRRRAQDRTGHIFAGPLTLIAVTRDWLSDPLEMRVRFWFFGLTALLIAASAAQAILA